MKRTASSFLLLAVVLAVPARADELVLPILAIGWPGKDGNAWSSEVFLTNPGSAPVKVANGRFLPGTLRVGVPCYPPVVPYRVVAPYSTQMVSARDLAVDLGCPAAALGGMTFAADGPVAISSRVVNTRGRASNGGALLGPGQDVPALGPAEVAFPGAVFQLPGLIWDPLRCGPPAFEVYLYLANAGAAPVDVTLLQSRDGAPGDLVLDGAPVTTPFTLTVAAGSFRQLKVEPGGPAPAVCGPPQLVDLFFRATGVIAAVASDVDRSSQDARTVVPVRTSD